MKPIIRTIEEAIKDLYALEVPYQAEDFLVTSPPSSLGVKVKNREYQGALLIQNGQISSKEEIVVGLYFNEEIREELSQISCDTPQHWSPKQLRAFCIAAEEVSHFHYFLFRTVIRRPVSQLELEIQGEIDKFLVTYFAIEKGDGSFSKKLFDSLFEQLFYRFRLAPQLTSEEAERYRLANDYARGFIAKWGKGLSSSTKRQKAFEWLPRFYRMGSDEKMSWIHQSKGL